MNKTKTPIVLIVEDEIVLQDVYKLVLTSAGYDVHTASNGLEGINQLKNTRPDIVLLDLFMPVMGGKEFLLNVDIKDYPKTKIVVYTNMSGGGTEKEMLELGAHGFVLKSAMSPKDLINLMDRLVKQP